MPVHHYREGGTLIAQEGVNIGEFASDGGKGDPFVQLIGAAGGARIYLRTAGAGSGDVPRYTAWRVRGTKLIPEVVQANDVLGLFMAGSGGATNPWSGFGTGPLSGLKIIAKEVFTDAARGVKAVLSAIKLGTAGAADCAELDADAAADQMRMLVYDETGAAMKRLARGAADSGGAGFRMLRIPN